jgi:Uma2 family endonuclease
MAIKEALPPEAQAEGQRRRFNRQEYHAMVEAGILTEDSRVELIEGEIIEMSPINPLHVATVAALMEWLVSQFAGKAFVTIQSPFAAGEASEPQPDAIVAKFRDDRYRQAHPTPEDILLVVEVSQSSLQYDRDRKARLYAAAGLADYWIVNLVDQTLDVYRQPGPRGYDRLQRFRPGDSLSPLAFPDVTLDVAAILPPAEDE